MGFINQAYRFSHEWWRYLLGVIVAICGVFLFSLPHFFALMYKKINGDIDFSQLQDYNSVLKVFDSNLNMFLLLIPFLGGLLFLLLVLKPLHHQKITSLTTSRSKIDWKRFWFAFLLWGGIIALLVIVDYWLNPDDFIFNFNLKPFLILCVIALILIPIQTSFEEYMFRGYLMQGIGMIAKNKWLPLLLTSVCFGLLHMSNPEVEKLGKITMVYYIGTGLFLGIITLMDEGIELSLGYHAANNIVAALLVTADWTAFQTHSVLKDISDPSETVIFDMLLLVAVILPIMLLIFAKVYGWSGWKHKLLGKVLPPSNEDYKIIE